MKQLFFLLILFSFETSAQFSLSAGIQRRKDYLGDENQFGKQSRYTYNLYFISLDFQHKKWLYHADFLWHYNDLHYVETTQNNGYYGSHGTHPYSIVHQYEADITYNYKGLKLGADRVLKGKNHFSMLIGLFSQVEVLVFEKERNHQIHRTENSFGSTKYSSMKGEYDALEFETPFLSGGLELKPRFSFNQIFFELNFTAGLFYHSRTVSKISGVDELYSSHTIVKKPEHNKYGNQFMEPINLFFECGLKVGYTFRHKMKEKQKTVTSMGNNRFKYGC